ncbi:MAG TPA: MMPL family transporter [Pseudonocardiaceae bacterium]|nr:MMPL family transporter [Pseudonocardiaceae bacterium]
MHAAFAAIGRFAVRFRWLVLVVWVAGAVAAATFLPSLASVTQSNNTDFLPANSPSTHAAQLAAPFQQATAFPVPVVVSRPGGPLTTADQDAIGELQQALKRTPGVITVKDLGRSPDGQAEQLQTLSNPSGGMNAQQTLVTDLRSSLSTVALPSGLQAHLAGSVATSVDTQAKSGSSGNQVQLLSIVFIIALLLLIFRALLAPLITLLPAFLVVTMAGPLVAEATHAGLKVSSLAQFMMIVLVLGAGTDYGLFLVFRVREEMRAGLASKDAVVRAVSRVGESITFSAGTVIAALLSLLAATFGIYSNLGIPLAIGIGLMLLAGLTLLPAVLAIFGRAVFWPSKVAAGSGKAGMWGRISGRIVRRPAVTLVVGLIAFGGLAIASLAYQPAGFGGTTTAPGGTDSAAGNDALAAHFPSTSASPTNILFQLPASVWDNPNVLATATASLKSNTDFSRVSGPLDPTGTALTPAELVQLHQQLGPANKLPPVPRVGLAVPPKIYQAYRATAEFVSADGRTVQFSVGLTAGDPSSTAAIQAVPNIRSDVDRAATTIGAIDHGVAGQAPALYDVSATSTNDLRTVVPIAIVVIGLLLALVMRSLVAPLYLIVSVGLSYLAALGLAVLLFMKIGGDGGLTFILPFLMFLFLLALGEDYNILVMTRIREEAQRLPLREAVSKALAATGTTVTSAGLVLAGTFAVFAIAAGGSSGGSQFRDVGFGIAVGVLMDTFLVRTLLVPSTVVLLGRWNWWPSKMARKQAAAVQPPEPVVVEAGSR